MPSEEKSAIPFPVTQSSNPQKQWLPKYIRISLCLFSACFFVILYKGPQFFIFSSFSTAEQKAHFVLTRFPLIDGHNDFPTFIRENYDNKLAQSDLHHTTGHTDIKRLRSGHIGGQFWSGFVECPPLAPDSFLAWNRSGEHEAVQQTLQQLDLIKRMIDKYPSDFSLATKSKDVKHNFLQKRISSMIGIEGLHQIAGSPSILRRYYELGVRYATLAHNCDNVFADAAVGGKQTNGGLSEAGRALVREMNRLGMMVDLSHVTPEVMHQALDVSVAPAFFSHSSAKAIHNHPRNVPDDVLLRVKETDGVVMVNFYPAFISATPENTTLETVVEHIQHIAKITDSYRHIGLGADYDGIEMVPRGLEDVSKYPALFSRLADLGLSVDELIDISGRNVLRVWRATEKASREVHDPLFEWEDDLGK
ncbi:dipeptidyl peptidase [Schizosaccharomyces cryophilus OY26]|uniref:Dipeptidase n=1 Tax=Schizosaccharomyces cryophilus (strain OY26 / ATCC MYA-4695 / CBS 11777 / NBRC 106824 / NRRL Y48691) TaxID=653667 RepID=S9X6J6_SCHCR|nr:dipeptidyl peptidase [Schizosaccharomyces cryophilus OY26]EPY52722.1 dipeptidyl peptidase [Schizosaccharomyces cryophilus OY26]